MCLLINELQKKKKSADELYDSLSPWMNTTRHVINLIWVL